MTKHVQIKMAMVEKKHQLKEAGQGQRKLALKEIKVLAVAEKVKAKVAFAR
jgi:hypothetical protein